MLTTRRAIVLTPHADPVAVSAELLELLYRLDLAGTVPTLSPAVDRARELLGRTLQDRDSAAHEIARGLADGKLTIEDAAERTVLLHVRSSGNEALRGPALIQAMLNNAARLTVEPAMTDLHAAGEQLHTALAEKAAACVRDATAAAADVPDTVRDDAAAFRLTEKGRKAWAKLTAAAADLATIQEAVDVLRDYTVIPGPADASEAANVDAQHLHYRAPWLLPTSVQTPTGTHPARVLLDVLAAQPEELTWQEYRAAARDLTDGFGNRARRAAGLPEVTRPATPRDLSDLAGLPSTA